MDLDIKKKSNDNYKINLKSNKSRIKESISYKIYKVEIK